MSENNKVYSQIKKNTVASQNQLKDSKLVRFMNPEGKGKRIMFVGNSITLHGILPSIGWHTECGMAASKPENDYVHILMSKIDEIASDSQYCICQVAEWERQFINGESKHYLFESARDFEADIIIARFVENCDRKDFNEEAFKKQYDLFLNYLNKSQKATIILTTGFWRHPADQVMIQYAKENNFPCVELGDLGESDEMKAIGLFEHDGVANHPGDTGMKKIAERIYQALENFL